MATGINGWQVSLPVTSSARPDFRAYSAGREGEPVGPSSPKWRIATGGFDLNGRTTEPSDNTVYWVMADFLKRTAVVTAGFVEIANPHRMPVPRLGTGTATIADPDNMPDPRLGPYSPQGQRVRSAIDLASDVEGLRLVLTSVLGDRYQVRVRDDGAVVGLWLRRPCTGRLC